MKGSLNAVAAFEACGERKARATTSDTSNIDRTGSHRNFGYRHRLTAARKARPRLHEVASPNLMWHWLNMKKQQSIAILQRQRTASDQLISVSSSGPEFTKWHRDTEIAIERIFGPQSRNLEDFKAVRYSLGAFSTSTPESEFRAAYLRGLKNAAAVLDSMILEIEEYDLDADTAESEPDQLSLIERLCLRFHGAARQLQHRYNDRDTLTINDEYDVQDLLHSILRLHFDDIRAEEWTPSYAGGSSRVDFLLKAEQIVIEVKKTRTSMKAKDLGEQLIIDRARYEIHPDCKTLVCFVYDPEGRIGNPVGIERDLEKHSGALRVRVIIAPKN